MTKANNCMIDIAVQEERWESALPGFHDLIEKSIRKTLSIAGYHPDIETEISVLLADDSFVQDLNNRYRNKDKPTNVLSFPQDEEGSLGDVILALETIERESAAQKKTLADHARHLLVHGTLHLLGMDHKNDGEAAAMEALEIKTLKALGVKNPYEMV